MPLVGAIIEGVPTNFQDVPPDVLSPEMVKALLPEERSGWHMTDLTICPYKVGMTKRHKFYLPVDICYRMARGKAWDALAMAYPRHLECIYQYNAKRTLNGELISGTLDILDLRTRAIEDYKRPEKAWGVGYTPIGYQLQLNGYYWLTFPTLDEDIDHLYLDMCGPAGYRQVEIAKWELHDIEMELAVRLDELMDVMSRYPTPRRCDDQDCIYCRGEVYYA